MTQAQAHTYALQRTQILEIEVSRYASSLTGRGIDWTPTQVAQQFGRDTRAELAPQGFTMHEIEAAFMSLV